MTKEELKEILASDESYRVERTISTTNMDKFQEAICAFANDLPGSRKKGYLLIGVYDDGRLSGLKVTDDLMKKIAGIRSDGNILPLPVMNTEKFSFPEGDVLVVEVTPSFDTPIRYRGRVFVRVGPRKDIASAEEERILTERCNDALPTFDVTPCRSATIEELDVDAIKERYMPAAIDAEELANDKRPLKEQMAALHLYNTKYDCPTHGAIILFGSRPRYFLPGCYVQYVRFDGLNNAAEIQNEREFNGSLFTILPQLDSFIRDAIVWQKPVPVSVLREKTVTNYPFAALRELVMNACMHRDYQSNTPIRLYQYSDRIEIMNAGGLYGEARPENFPTVNAYRNPVIAEVLKTLKYVNKFNRGISRVQDYLKENESLPAEFHVDKLTVFEAIVKNALDETGEKETFTPAFTPQKREIEKLADKLSNSVKLLVVSIEDGWYAAKEIKLAPQLTTEVSAEVSTEVSTEVSMTKQSVHKNYILPAVEVGLIERLYPNNPHHPKQRYRLTELGLALRQFLRSSENCR